MGQLTVRLPAGRTGVVPQDSLALLLPGANSAGWSNPPLNVLRIAGISIGTAEPQVAPSPQARTQGASMTTTTHNRTAARTTVQ
ncbi:hypothetical protein AB4Y88_19260, partial [Paenarthrobacter sp. RAF9]